GPSPHPSSPALSGRVIESRQDGDKTVDAGDTAGGEGPEVRLPFPCLVVLVGPSGSGKSTWAAANFRPAQVVAADDMRALVGEGPYDQRAGTDAFDVLDLVLERRL